MPERMVKIEDLDQIMMDFLIARSLNLETYQSDDNKILLKIPQSANQPEDMWIHFSPTQFWHQGGPIIEDSQIATWYSEIDNEWSCYCKNPGSPMFGGSTPLLAAMKLYLHNYYGDEVDINNVL